MTTKKETIRIHRYEQKSTRQSWNQTRICTSQSYSFVRNEDSLQCSDIFVLCPRFATFKKLLETKRIPLRATQLSERSVKTYKVIQNTQKHYNGKK